MQVHVCMQIHTLNRCRLYMHSVSKKCVYHSNFMMHANACCTCNLIITSDVLGYYNRVFSRIHYSDDFTNSSFHIVYSHAEKKCVNQCVQYIMFKCQSVHCSGLLPVQNTYGFLQPYMQWTHKMCLHPHMHGLKRVYDVSIYMFICISVHCTEHVWVHVRWYSKIINTTHSTPAGRKL